MGKEQSLGIVMPIPKGEWSATKEYQELNIVRHGIFQYISKKKNIGIEPSISANWAEYWMIL